MPTPQDEVQPKGKESFSEALRRNIIAIRYAAIVLAVFVIVILGFSLDWKAILGLRAADSCPAILGTPTMGKITITEDVTLSAQSYPSGVVDCSETDIEIATGVTVTLEGYDNGDSDWTNDYGVTWNVHSLDLNSGAYMTTDGKGYAATRGAGSGETGTGTTAGAGGGHGGAGGEGQAEIGDESTEGGTTYGNSLNPSTLGSGGGNSGTGGAGAAGGGVAKIVSTGTVTIDGEITADGLASTAVSGSSGGGGAGGTVFIEAATLAGAGSVTADGGDSYNVGIRGGGGGGGRVVMYCTSQNSFSGSVSASGGVGGIQNGGDGTVIGPTCYPEVPTDIHQYKTSVAVENELAVGDSTQSSTIVFQMTISDIDSTDTIYPQIEVAEVGVEFTGAPTATGAGINYTGTPVQVTINKVLTTSKQYHWRARVKDEAGAVSDWVSFGENAEAENDFIISGTPTTLQYVGGNNQTGSVSAQLVDPLEVRVVDQNGLPVGEYYVGWSVASGGGELSAITTYTDRAGYASVDWTLGPNAGTDNNTARATRTGLVGSPMTFTASASADDVDHYQITVPQSALTGQNFTVTVTALDQYDNIVTAASNSVDLSAVLSSDGVTPGSGTLVPSQTTLANGISEITTTSYSVAESIKIKAVDASLNEGLSNAIAVVDAYGSCPDPDGIIDVSQTWAASPANGGVFDCTGLDLVVTNSAILTLDSYDSGDGIWTNDLGVTVLADSLNVNVGAKIVGDATGYAGNSGPGGGTAQVSMGGIYGGTAYGNTTLTRPYGSIYEPDALGSGGNSWQQAGGIGGGAVKLVLTGNVVVDGTVSANGGNEPASTWSGGGSGGSIWIDGAAFSGGGLISANGGDGEGATDGSGGRIAVYYTSSTYSGSYQCKGYTAGGPGTIYIEHKGVDTEHQGTLMVDNGDIVSNYSAVIPEGDYQFASINLLNEGNVSFRDYSGTLTASSNSVFAGDSTAFLNVYGNVVIPDTFTVNYVELGIRGDIVSSVDGTDTSNMNLTISSTGKLNLYADAWGAAGGNYEFDTIDVDSSGHLITTSYSNTDTVWTNDWGVTISANNITVDASGSINANATGYLGTKGPGGGSVQVAMGGVYGGTTYGATTISKPYGNVYSPVDLGSGGNSWQDVGGVGGGALKLEVSGTLTNNGTISSNGGNYPSGWSGGGSGGSVWIDAATFDGAGLVSANGGDGYGSADGGGGRIAIYYSAGNYFTAGTFACYGNVTGGPGTVYVENTSTQLEHKGDVYVNANGINGYTAVIPAGSPAPVNFEFENIVLQNYGDLALAGVNDTTILSSELVLNGDSNEINDLYIYGTLQVATEFDFRSVNTHVLGLLDGADTLLTVSNEGTLTLHAEAWGVSQGEYTFNNIVLEDTGVLAMDFAEDDDTTFCVVSTDAECVADYGVILNAQNITVNTGGMLSGDDLGYGYDDGPGGYGGGNGAAHGGYDVDHTPYGSVTEPVASGSGGSYTAQYAGGKGGAPIRLIVSETLTVDGTITSSSSDGHAGSYGYSAATGGGSGGSIWITADTLATTGSGEMLIAADGGNGGQGVYLVSPAKGGSGGRIAIYYNTDEFRANGGSVTAYGGYNPQGWPNEGDITTDGNGAGTVYWENVVSGYSELYVDNNNNDWRYASLPEADYTIDKVSLTRYGHTILEGPDSSISMGLGAEITGDVTKPDFRIDGLLNAASDLYITDIIVGINGDLQGLSGTLTIGDNSNFELYADAWGMTYGEFTFNDIVIESGGSLVPRFTEDDDTTFCVLSTDEECQADYGSTINARNITIEAGGQITGDDLGYGYDDGPGGYGGGNGAAHGGYDVDHTPYGSVTEPVASGSGGSYTAQYAGGKGGAPIRLIISETLTVDGTITSSSSDGHAGSYGYSAATGGGSGGSIWITADTLATTGSGEKLIKADGGDGGAGVYLVDPANGGAGGRIAIYINTDNYRNNGGLVTAFGGNNGGDVENGNGAGTIYWENSTSGYSELYVDNNDNDWRYASLPEDDYTLDKISLTGYGHTIVEGVNSSISLGLGAEMLGDVTQPELRIDGLLNAAADLEISDVTVGINGDLQGLEGTLTINDGSEVILYADAWGANDDDDESGVLDPDEVGAFSLGSVVVKSGGLLTLTSVFDDDTVYPEDINDVEYREDHGINLSLVNLTVENGGLIDLKGQGYYAKGPGGDTMSIGAGHGGYGGNGGDISYDDLYAPVLLGSGGEQNSTDGGQYDRNTGGGAAYIVASGDVLIDGEIDADGLPAYYYSHVLYTHYRPGGSGGSLWFDVAGAMTGSGNIHADGGDGSGAVGGGAGGIIAVYAGNYNYLGILSAYGGLVGGGPGPVYVEDRSIHTEGIGDLFIDNNDVVGSTGRFLGDTYYFDDVVVGNNVTWPIIGDTSVETDGEGVKINVNNDFTSGTGSTIDGVGYGFPAGEGPGVGADGSIVGGGDGSGGGGGAYGGDGGQGQDDLINGVTAGGTGYGDAVHPLSLGSGGGASGAGTSGGRGGSAFAVYALDGTITVNGTIDMSGTVGLVASPGGGGGAGGSILLKGDEVILGASSELYALGGDGGDDSVDGGGGGGGRISVLFGTSHVADGTIDRDGGDGAYGAAQQGTLIGPIGLPADPDNMDQKETDDQVSVPVGGTTPDTEIDLVFDAEDADPTDILTPQIEIRPQGVPFQNVVTNAGNSVNYVGVPEEVSVRVQGLVLGASYHWQARVVDNTGVPSSWVSFGGNTESEADFTVTRATKYVLTPSATEVGPGGIISLTVSAQDDTSFVDTAYRGTVRFTSTDTGGSLPSDYTFTGADAGEHTFVNGITMGNLGDHTITATDTVDGSITGTTDITVSGSITISESASTVEADPEMIEDDGVETSTITVTLTDNYGNPIAGKLVTLAATGTGNTLVQPEAATDGNGQTTGTIASTIIGDKVVSASVPGDGINLQDTATVLVRDRIPPVISNVQVTNITETSATISWETNEPTTGQVEYGLGYLYGSTSEYQDELSTNHSVTLTGLDSGTVYYFRILARDESENETYSANQTFETDYTPEEEAAIELALESVVISDITTNSAKVVWETNKSSTAVLMYGTTEDVSTSVTISESGRIHEYSLTGLSKGTTYYVKIRAIAGSEQVESDIRSFTTLQDANAVQIKDIVVKNIAYSSATVTFTTSKPAKIVFKYGRTTAYGGELVDNEYKTEHEYNLIDLYPDTDYHFIIEATDEDGYTTKSADQIFHTLERVAEGGIVAVSHERVEDQLKVMWETTHPMTCHLEYGDSVDYGNVTDDISPVTGNEYEYFLDLQEDAGVIEIHYRVICEDSGRTYSSLDQVYTDLNELPMTGDEEEWYETALVVNTAKYAVPGVALTSILLQLLSLLPKTGGYLNLGRIFGAIFDKDKKKRGWGIVYDVHKKMPIPFVVVRLYDAKTKGLVEETVTDLKGRYRFVTEDGKYTIGVQHSEFAQPESDALMKQGLDITGKYLGGEIEIVGGKTAVGYDIPMVSKSRLEKDNKYRNARDRFVLTMDKIGVYLNWIGGILLILSVLIAPTITNWILLAVNVIILVVIYVAKSMQPKDWGIVYDVANGQPLKGVFVRLFDDKEKKLINTQITDENGRYGFLLDIGAYLLGAEASGYEITEKREVKGLLVESKGLGQVVKIAVSKDEQPIKQDLPLKSTGESPIGGESPFGKS